MSMKVSQTPTGLRPDIGLALDNFDLQADQEGFVGLKIAPAAEVDLEQDSYPVRKIGDKLRQKQTSRNSDGTYTSSDISAGSQSYKTEDHGHEVRVDDRNAKIYKHFLNADLAAAEVARDVVLRGHNERVIRKALAVTNVTDITGLGQSGDAVRKPWTDVTSDPIAVVRHARINVRNRGGGKPNVMVVEFEVFEYLRDNDTIIERIKYQNNVDVLKFEVGAPEIAAALGLQELIVADSIENTANEAQSPVLTPQWDKTKALLFTRSTRGTAAKTQFMRTFHWGEDGSRIGGAFEKYRDDSVRGYKVRSRMESAEDIVFEESGEVIDNVAA